MQKSVAKKLFAVGLAASTIAWAGLPFTALAAAHAEGTNVKKSDGTVGMIIGSQWRPYTSAGAFLSYGFNSWATVVDANADDLALPVGSFIPPQDGTIFCATDTKDSDVKGECSLITGGQKAAFTSAAVFTGLGFSFTRAEYGDSSWMTKTSNIDSSTAAHRPGVLVNNGGTVQLVGSSGLMGIPDIATFNSWGYSFADVVPANTADKAMTQTGVMATRVAGQLSPTALAVVPPVISGNVSVSLASDTPAAATVAIHSSYKSVVNLAKFVFSGTGTVTQVQVKRIGVSPDTIISNAYLFEGSTRLTDAASVGGSSLITFNDPNGLFTVSGSKTVSVVVEITANSSSGQTVGAQLTSFTVASSSAVSASISGNTMTISNVGTDLAYADFGTVTPTGGAYDPAVDVEVFKSNVTVNSRNMVLSRLIMRNIGSVNYTDVKNLRLRIDGTQVAQVADLSSNGYAYFSFSPVTVLSGTRVFSVLADVIGGSSRTFQFQIRNAADVDFMDSQYGVTVATNDTYPVGSAAANDINAGSITFQKASDSPSGNVTLLTNDVSIAKYTVTAYGEPMKIETLRVAATSSNASVGSLRNGRILIGGVQYGSTATLVKCTTCDTATPDAGGTQYTLNYTVNPGSPVTLQINADMYDNDSGGQSLVNTNTITGYILVNTSNVQKMVSAGYLGRPSAVVAANPVTVVTGSATLNKNGTYANQTIPLPQTQYKLGAYNLVGSSSEDMTLSSIDLSITASSTLLDYSELTNVKALINGNLFGTIKSTLSSGSSTYSGNYTLVKNQTVTVEFFGDVSNVGSGGAAGEYVRTVACANGTTSGSSTSVVACQAGQTLTYGASSISVAQDPTTPVAAIVAGNQTRTVGAFKITTLNDSYTISEVTIALTAFTTVQNVILKDGSTVLGTLPGGVASVTFSNLSAVVPANSSKVFTVDLQLGSVGIGAGQSGENVKVTWDSYKNAPSSTGVISTDSSSDPLGNNTYVYKAIPTVTNVTLPTGILVAGTNTLAKVQISSGGTGTISWTHLVFTYSTSSGILLANPVLKDADTSTTIAASSSIDVVNGRIVIDTTTEQQITGAKVYSLTADVTEADGLDTGDYVSTYLNDASGSFTAPTTAGSATTTIATSLVWSDQSGSYTTGTPHSMLTWDWNNDYLVKNIQTDSQTLMK